MWFIGVELEQETSAPPPKKKSWIRPCRGVRPPLLLDLTEKNLRPPLPPYRRVWMILSPFSESLDPPVQGDY